MPEIEKLVATIKRELRARDLTYRDVAKKLALSEASVKRLFSGGDFTLERLVALAALLDLTLAELASLAASSEPKLRQLTAAQEAEIVSDEKLLLVAACALNHWTEADIVAAYRLSSAECIQRLLRLDRLRLIDLLPGNRVRLNVARDFDWLPDGPIRRYFREEGEADFLAAAFHAPGETHTFSHGMLTAAAVEELRTQIRRLRQQFSTLHDESLREPITQRRGTGLLVAVREWEPKSFAKLRRQTEHRPAGRRAPA